MTIPQMEPWLGEEEATAVQDYMRSGGWLMERDKTRQFESMIADYTGASHCIATVNGTVEDVSKAGPPVSHSGSSRHEREDHARAQAVRAPTRARVIVSETATGQGTQQASVAAVPSGQTEAAPVLAVGRGASGADNRRSLAGGR